jgi:arylsulfatase
VSAQVELKNGLTNGVIIAQAGRFGGWSLYMKNGKACHEYNFFGLDHTRITSSKTLAPGRHEIKYDFIIDVPKPGSGGKCILYVDGAKVAEGVIPKTEPYFYSADEGVDVGMDSETNVSKDYLPGKNKFEGKILRVTVSAAPSKTASVERKTEAIKSPCPCKATKCPVIYTRGGIPFNQGSDVDSALAFLNPNACFVSWC